MPIPRGWSVSGTWYPLLMVPMELFVGPTPGTEPSVVTVLTSFYVQYNNANATDAVLDAYVQGFADGTNYVHRRAYVGPVTPADAGPPTVYEAQATQEISWTGEIALQQLVVLSIVAGIGGGNVALAAMSCEMQGYFL